MGDLVTFQSGAKWQQILRLELLIHLPNLVLCVPWEIFLRTSKILLWNSTKIVLPSFVIFPADGFFEVKKSDLFFNFQSIPADLLKMKNLADRARPLPTALENPDSWDWQNIGNAFSKHKGYWRKNIHRSKSPNFGNFNRCSWTSRQMYRSDRNNAN